MDGWEALWASQRAAIVKRIKDNKWGVSADGKTLTGPEGFSVDLSKCESGWSETEGLTDTDIKLGITIAQSGTLAYTAYYGKGEDAMFSYYSGKGAFKDVNGKTRKITYIQKDDGYDPARTIPLVDEMIDSDKVFGLSTTGSPNTLRTYDKLNERCVPQLFNLTGHPAWGDPVNHPWTTGLGLAYTTEAVLWGEFIAQHMSEYPNGVTVAALVENNDFGHIYDFGFRNWLDKSPNKAKIKYVTESVDPQTPTITDPMTTLAAAKPDFFIAEVAGSFCTQAVTEAANNGMHDKVKYLWQPDTCAGSTQLSKEKVGGDGSASKGWWIVNGGSKDIVDPAQQADPTVAWARGILSAKGYNPDDATEQGLGMIYAWGWSQTIMIAGQLDGGLTRANLLLAARSLDMNNPLQLPGLVFHMNGNKDSYYTEGAIYQQFDVAKQGYVNNGTLVNLDGKSPNCKFDQSKGACEPY
jgi:branched-chain amino acid transport system substrate-binding protein